MNRSAWITGVIVAQAVWASALMAIAVFLIILARTAAPEVSSGLKIGAVTLAVPALLATVSWYGLWKETLWGWWLAFLTNFALMVMLVYSMVDDGLRDIDWDMAGITVTSMILPVLLLTPGVRRIFFAYQGKTII